jgi:RHS repeat-associated protein
VSAAGIIIEPSTIQHPDLEDRRWVIGYDAGGLPVSESQPGGVEIVRVFDNLGRMTTETGLDSGISASRVFDFDLAGRLTTVSHPSGDNLVYTYDERGLMLTSSGPAGASSFEYDGLGRMISRDDPSAAGYVFTWTGRSELEQLYDPITGVTFDYVWTAASQLDQVIYGTTGLERDYEWDDRGLLESDRLETTAGVGVASISYEYDSDGNVRTEYVSLPSNPQSGTHTYLYDDAGRLTSWDFSATTVEYQWDGAGNRITADGDTYTYDHRNRLTNGPDGDYTYTPRGTLSQIDDGGTVTTYGFDPLGRMVDYNGEAAFSYDGLDRVAERNSVPFTYTGTMLDAVDDGSHSYGRTPAGRLVSQTNNGTGEVSLIGLDRHGDLTWLANPGTGDVTGTFMFDPYGDPTATIGDITPKVGFQGDYTDPASGEVWMGARWYSGADAVFRSRDTVFGELRTPISLNRYTYG